MLTDLWRCVSRFEAFWRRVHWSGAPGFGLGIATCSAWRRSSVIRCVSAYLEKAAQRQIERDNLDELIADFDKVHGPADPEAVAAARARLTGGATNAGAAS